ncbi:DUF885 domain-containing protein [Flindersiella endophytica]
MGATDDIADRYVDDYAAADPVGATFAGIAGHEHELTDYSPDGFAARAELERRTVAALEAVEAATASEQVAKAAMIERLGLSVELYDAGLLTSDLNVTASPLQDMRGAFDLMSTDGEESWQAISDRLAAIPGALAAYRRSLLSEAEQGRVSARRQVLACADQCRAWQPDEDNVFGGLVETYDGSGPLRSALDRGASAAGQALGEFERFLRQELAPKAGEKDAVGRDRYALASRYFLGAVVDLDETYTWGWEELARIESEMAAVSDRIVPGGSVDDAVAALDADPALQLPDKESFRAWLQDLTDRTIDELASTHFDIPEPVRRMECCLAPTSEGGIYYTGPSEDFSRPGRMWWSVPKGVTSFTTWREVTTSFHEGVPGHHLQIGQTAFRKDRLNRWQRLLCWVSGHGEGWALYAEQLMDELGYLDDPGAKLGMLDAQGFRAARVIVDIGMHLELPIPANAYGWRVGERWTPELGLEFLLAHSRIEEEFLRFELNRYLGWPGQAPSYKVGERIWLQARKDAETRKGAAFDLKEFHRAALDLGGLGLDPLQAALREL